MAIYQPGKEIRGLSHVHEKCPDGFADCSVNAAVMIGHADYSMLMPTGALCLLLMTFFDPARVVSTHLFVLMVVMVEQEKLCVRDLFV